MLACQSIKEYTVNLPIEQIEAEALKLPEEDRARLAETLLQSLAASLESQTEQTWAEEAERRHQTMLRDGDEGIPAEDVFHELDDSLR